MLESIHACPTRAEAADVANAIAAAPTASSAETESVGDFPGELSAPWPRSLSLGPVAWTKMRQDRLGSAHHQLAPCRRQLLRSLERAEAKFIVALPSPVTPPVVSLVCVRAPRSRFHL